MVSTFLASKSLDLGQSSTASPDFLARFARLYGSYALPVGQRIIEIYTENTWTCRERICPRRSHVKCLFSRIGQFFDAKPPEYPESLERLSGSSGYCLKTVRILFLYPPSRMDGEHLDSALRGLFRKREQRQEEFVNYDTGRPRSPPVPQIPRSRVFSAGVRFRPSQDTVYLRNGGNGLRAVLGNANPAELVVTNI